MLRGGLDQKWHRTHAFRDPPTIFLHHESVACQRSYASCCRICDLTHLIVVVCLLCSGPTIQPKFFTRNMIADKTISSQVKGLLVFVCLSYNAMTFSIQQQSTAGVRDHCLDSSCAVSVLQNEGCCSGA